MKEDSFLAQCRSACSELGGMAATRIEGQVAGVAGLAVELRGVSAHLSVGDRLALQPRAGAAGLAEVVGFRGGLAHALAFESIDGIGPGRAAVASLPPSRAVLAVADSWIGRVLDPLGRPIDRRGALAPGAEPRNVRAGPPVATQRARLGPPVDLGVRALNAFATCRQGQRLGLFAGAGIGKSTLLAMLARHAACDVAVLALVGERGREVREFIEDELGPAGLARSVVVVATSDAPPLMRREAACAAMTIAEHFRDAGRHVLLLMDSVTRYCSALREIGMSAGEPPTARGYPPSVFAELPRLLERAGPGLADQAVPGQISALFTVLVEADDHNEPVSDAIRAILDGHIVLDRRIAERGRYPAIDVLRSISRTMSGCTAPEDLALARRARGLLSLHADLSDLVRLGAYRPGLDPAADEAIALAPRIEAFLQQTPQERTTIAESFAQLRAVLGASQP